MPLRMLSVNGFWKRSLHSRGEELCISIINQARNPYFYDKWGVPDTLEGRFDCAILHLCLMMRHLKGPLAQAAFDAFFSYTELTLREVGVSDLKVGKQVQKCAKFFYGALKAYNDGFEGTANLKDALVRNLYGNVTSLWVTEVEDYMRRCDQNLYKQDIENSRAPSMTWLSLG